MLHYTSLLKGKLFKTKKLKSSFLIEDKKDSFQIYNARPSRKESSKFRTLSSSLKMISKKSKDLSNYEKINNIDEDEFLSEDYEDLFFYFLYEKEKIEFFENMIETKKEKRLNNKYYFNYIYQAMTDEKIEWNHFLFPEAVYKLLYIKSRKLLKEIIQYSIYSGKKVDDILNAYDKKYTYKKKVKNWCLKPQDAYKNYEKIILNLKNEKENSNNGWGGNHHTKNANFTDFVVKTDNNGKGKTLIFLGKAINIYIDDLDKFENKDKGLSMAVEESEFNKNTKNEIVYTFDDMILKTKKRNTTISNKNEINKFKNNQKIWERFISKDLGEILNMNFKHSMKHIRVDKSEKNKNKISKQKSNLTNNAYNNFNNTMFKLPSIGKSNNVHANENLFLKEKKNKKENKDKPSIKNNEIEKMKFRKICPEKKRKTAKKYINSFSIYEREYIPKRHNKIINFFTKGNSDFYY